MSSQALALYRSVANADFCHPLAMHLMHLFVLERIAIAANITEITPALCDAIDITGIESAIIQR
jgi:hypothetical protein